MPTSTLLDTKQPFLLAKLTRTIYVLLSLITGAKANYSSRPLRQATRVEKERLVAPVASQDSTKSLSNYLDVGPNRHILDVVEIKFDPVFPINS